MCSQTARPQLKQSVKSLRFPAVASLCIKTTWLHLYMNSSTRQSKACPGRPWHQHQDGKFDRGQRILAWSVFWWLMSLELWSPWEWCSESLWPMALCWNSCLFDHSSHVDGDVAQLDSWSYYRVEVFSFGSCDLAATPLRTGKRSLTWVTCTVYSIGIESQNNISHISTIESSVVVWLVDGWWFYQWHWWWKWSCCCWWW